MARRRRTGAQGESPACIRNKDAPQLIEGRTSRGNGRIGRLLIVLVLLHDERVIQSPMLYLSLYFKRNRAEYYRKLDAVRSEGDWESWIGFFLEGVEQTATSAVDTIQRLISLFEEDRRKIQSLHRKMPTALQVSGAFCQRPLLSMGQICQQTHLSFPAVAKAVEPLQRLGIVREITGQHRNRLFAYEEYLLILSEGTEPL